MSQGMRTFSESQLTPRQQAQIEISLLNTDPDLQPEFVAGGVMSPEMVATNERKRRDRSRRIRAILVKYDVVDEYISQLQDEAQILRRRLEEINAEIAELERVRQESLP